MGKGSRNRLLHQTEEEQLKEFMKLPGVKKFVTNIVMEQLASKNEEFYDNEISTILWTARRTFGFGKKRLERYFWEYEKNWKALQEKYEAGDDDMSWLCEEMLLRDGIDFRRWKENGYSHV